MVGFTPKMINTYPINEDKICFFFLMLTSLPIFPRSRTFIMSEQDYLTQDGIFFNSKQGDSVTKTQGVTEDERRKLRKCYREEKTLQRTGLKKTDDN